MEYEYFRHSHLRKYMLYIQGICILYVGSVVVLYASCVFVIKKLRT